MFWKIVIIAGIVIFVFLVIVFIYLMVISKRDGEVNNHQRGVYDDGRMYPGNNPKQQDPWTDGRDKRPEDQIHWENYGYDENGKKRF